MMLRGIIPLYALAVNATGTRLAAIMIDSPNLRRTLLVRPLLVGAGIRG